MTSDKNLLGNGKGTPFVNRHGNPGSYTMSTLLLNVQGIRISDELLLNRCVDYL